MSDDLMARVRAFLDQAKRDESMTDEQRAGRTRNQRILGSLDDTHALTRYERDRGCTHLSSLPLIGLAFVALGLWGYVTGLQPWQWVAFGVCAAFAFICVGCCGDGSVRDRLDAEAPKRWDA